MDGVWVVKEEVAEGIAQGIPVVAFESTVLTHGLPYPQSRDLALDVERIVSLQGCVPATIGIIEGVIHVGMTEDEIDRLAGDKTTCKASAFDIAMVIASRRSAGTTVSGTLAIAERAGISVFATGGIGGVHRGFAELHDVSHDISSLARSRVVAVSAGAKAILDLPKTLECLETAGVCVVGYRTRTFPAFYYRDSGLALNHSAETANEVARAFILRRELGLPGGLLVAVPVPEEYELPRELVDSAIDRALAEADARGIRGKELTPFLLARLAEITDGRSVETNLALLKNNARVGAEIAVAIAADPWT
ncbi:MAG: pseudouridine-5'-phosphate glycosidase [Firmicutes bacterium]|nr:pseudouridine-5'-phosphate glycosidase [Bacillota bacterium]MDH7494762.1 pseudouridine-5'-phosphate glycosidase [Bacillota bacterium]